MALHILEPDGKYTRIEGTWPDARNFAPNSYAWFQTYEGEWKFCKTNNTGYWSPDLPDTDVPSEIRLSAMLLV